MSANVDTRVIVRDVIFAYCSNWRSYHGMRDYGFKNLANYFQNKWNISHFLYDNFSLIALKELVPPRIISFSVSLPDVAHEEILVLAVQDISTTTAELQTTFPYM